MRFPLGVVIVLMVFSVCDKSYSEQLPEWIKVENGLSISWQRISSDVAANQISISKLSEISSRSLLGLNILRIVPEAMRVTVYDVSARGNLIAVGAVYRSKNTTFRNTAALLLFNFKGDLLSMSALAPSHSAERLEIDESSHIWSLTGGPGKGAGHPSKDPMVVEYSSEGKVLRELLPRSNFPFHATDTKGEHDIGFPWMGYDSGLVWIWLPGSTDLVTISVKDGKFKTEKTGLPMSDGKNLVPMALFRESSGNVLVQVSRENRGLFEPAYYTWSPSKRSWSDFKPQNCGGGRLIGTNDKRQVYLAHVDSQRTVHKLCTSAMSLADVP